MVSATAPIRNNTKTKVVGNKTTLKPHCSLILTNDRIHTISAFAKTTQNIMPYPRPGGMGTRWNQNKILV